MNLKEEQSCVYLYRLGLILGALFARFFDFKSALLFVGICERVCV